MKASRYILNAGCAVLLAACQGEEPASEQAPAAAEQADTGGPSVPGNTDDTAPFSEIAEDEVLRFTGTEPFWGGEVNGTSLTYNTPENPEGTAIAVERFAGRGGLAFSGVLDGAEFEMMITPLECSDGMSDRTYPFTATLKIGAEDRKGCAWSEQHPFAGPAQP